MGELRDVSVTDRRFHNDPALLPRTASPEDSMDGLAGPILILEARRSVVRFRIPLARP